MSYPPLMHAPQSRLDEKFMPVFEMARVEGLKYSRKELVADTADIASSPQTLS